MRRRRRRKKRKRRDLPPKIGSIDRLSAKTRLGYSNSIFFGQGKQEMAWKALTSHKLWICIFLLGLWKWWQTNMSFSMVQNRQNMATNHSSSSWMDSQQKTGKETTTTTTTWWKGEEKIDSFFWNNVRGVNSMWKINNLCYSPKRGSWVVYKVDAKLLPKFVQDSPKLVTLEHPLQVSFNNTKWIGGVSLLYDDLRMEESGAHLYFHLLPVLSGWRMAKERWPIESISVVFRHLKTRKAADKQLLDLVLYHVPRKQLVELDSSEMSRYDVICWEHAIRVDQSYVSTADSFMFSIYLKELVKDKYGIDIPQHCKKNNKGHPQVWIIQRRVKARQILNIEQLVQFLESKGISRENIRVFDSPNAACSSTGCFGYAVCDDITQQSQLTCRKSGHRLEEDIELFSQITFLISIHGAGNVHYLWMPPGAHVVEIFPYHFLPTKVYETFANTSGLKYFQYQVEDSSVYLEKMEKRTHNFTVHQCWSDNSCRPKVKQLPVYLPLEDQSKLSNVLEKALKSWQRECHQR